MRKNFLVTHFFNPPRYMRLLEIVPSPPHRSGRRPHAWLHSSPRGSARASSTHKDTPNFVANRIGVFAICNAIHHMVAAGPDRGGGRRGGRAGHGPPEERRLPHRRSGRHRHAGPRGANTRTNCSPSDEQRECSGSPAFVQAMVERKGFSATRRSRASTRRSRARAARLLFFDYAPASTSRRGKPRFASVEAAKGIDDPRKRLQARARREATRGPQLAWRTCATRSSTPSTASRRSPTTWSTIDDAMRWGFNWELGPFEMLDAIGVTEFVGGPRRTASPSRPRCAGSSASTHFEGGTRRYLISPPAAAARSAAAGRDLDLSMLEKAGAVVEQNAAASVLDLGDGVFCLEFHTKMNAIGGDMLAMIHKALRRAEEEGRARHRQQGQHFSAGANLMLIAMAIAEGAYDEIGLTVKGFQKAMMALKYSTRVRWSRRRTIWRWAAAARFASTPTR